MKKKGLFTLFVASQLVMIFLYIHKESRFIKSNYKNQKLEKSRQQLILEKQNLKQKLHLVQNKNQIKKFAQENLKMKKTKLNQIKIVDNDNSK